MKETGSSDTDASLDALPHGFVRVDGENRIVSWNQRMEQWTHLNRANVAGSIIDDVFGEDCGVGSVLTRVRTSRQPQVLSQAFHRYFLPIALPPEHISGFTMMQQEVHLKPLAGSDGHLAITVFDVTAEVVGQTNARQIRAELETARVSLAGRVQELDASLREIRTLHAALDEHGAVVMFDTDHKITFANDKVLSITERNRDEIIGADYRETYGEGGLADCFEEIQQRLDAGEIWRGDLKGISKSGAVFWKNVTMVPFPGVDGSPERFVSIGHDITDRIEAKEAVAASLAEKEILLKEVHHRVKNNMQVISSMLQLQRGYVDDPRFKSIIGDCQNRVMSMAMVHEKLYQSPNLASVDFGQHVQDLARMLIRSIGGRARAVELILETESHVLDIDTAIPVGLILNELVTNAVKHGKNGKRISKVWVRFRAEIGGLLLSVQDNGPGLPVDFDLKQAKTLGLRMINILSAQIRGRTYFQNDNGTVAEIRFRPAGAFRSKQDSNKAAA